MLLIVCIKAKVRRAVVFGLFVLVVHNLVALQQPAKLSLHHKPVLSDVSLLCAVWVLRPVQIHIALHDLATAFPACVPLTSARTRPLRLKTKRLARATNRIPAHAEKVCNLVMLQALDFNQVAQLNWVKNDLFHW